MGKRKITIGESALVNIAKISLFIESKGLVTAAESFSESVYDFIEKLADKRLTHSICREPNRMLLGLKCRPFKKKYTIVFVEDEQEIIVTEFVPSKIIKW